jgi:hypothetical protein
MFAAKRVWRCFMQRDRLSAGRFSRLFRWVLCALLIFAGWFVSGCAGGAGAYEYEYKVVEVPVRCDAEKPQRPPKDEDSVLSLINALAYAEELERALNICIK